MKDKAASETAYVHRNSNYIFEMERVWTLSDNASILKAQAEWLSNYYDDMKVYLQPESYVNFPNRELENWAHQYYGSNLARLTEVKSKYDKGNLFKFQQSIPLATKP